MIANFAKWFADRTYYRRKAARYEEKIRSLKKEYDTLLNKATVISDAYTNLQTEVSNKIEENRNLRSQYIKVVSMINAKGGQEFLDHGILPGQEGRQQFDEKELRTLISLCHPDKHSGRQSAVEITQKLLKLSGR